MLKYYFLRWSFKLSLFEIQSTVETSIWNLLRIYSSSCKNYVWRKPSILLSPWKIPFSRYSTLQSQMSVCPSVCQQNHSTAWNHHSSSLILHPSSFFIHPSSLFIILHSSFLHFATFKLFSLFVFALTSNLNGRYVYCQLFHSIIQSSFFKMLKEAIWVWVKTQIEFFFCFEYPNIYGTIVTFFVFALTSNSNGVFLVNFSIR